jgi:hypothetical protein
MKIKTGKDYILKKECIKYGSITTRKFFWQKIKIR